MGIEQLSTISVIHIRFHLCNWGLIIVTFPMIPVGWANKTTIHNSKCVLACRQVSVFYRSLTKRIFDIELVSISVLRGRSSRATIFGCSQFIQEAEDFAFGFTALKKVVSTWQPWILALSVMWPVKMFCKNIGFARTIKSAVSNTWGNGNKQWAA